MKSVFEQEDIKNYPYLWAGALHIHTVAGGIPTDSRKADAWLRSKFEARDETLEAMVAEVMAERLTAGKPISKDEAADLVVAKNHLNGFKRDSDGLYIEGRQLKAAIKEAANIRWPWPTKKWKVKGASSGKSSPAFFAEHVFVRERRLHLGVPDGSDRIYVDQRFVHTWRGSGIQYEERVDDVEVEFTVETDYDFDHDEWAALWLTGQRQGIGATRSQGCGTYVVTRWDRLT